MTGERLARGPAATADALPLRSLTGVWVLVGLFGVGFAALAGRSLVPSEARSQQSAATATQGPTKEQVRQRQEHIALTERALELARKERKPVAQSPAAPLSAGSASAAPPPDAPASAPTKASADPPAKPAAPAADKPGQPAAAQPAAAQSAPAQPAAAQSAPSGLDALRADVGVSFE